MTPPDADALRVADRCVKAVTGYGIAQCLREFQANEEVAAALARLAGELVNQDRQRN